MGGETGFPAPGATLRARGRLLAACVCGLLLFAVLSWHRSHLVARGADPERAHWLLAGDESGYLLLAQAIAAGDGLNVRPSHERGSYRAFQPKPVIGPKQWTWAYYRSLGFTPRLDRSASWGDRQVLPRLPLYSALLALLAGQTGELRWAVAFSQALLVAATAAAVVFLCTARGAGSAWLPASALLLALGSIPAAYYASQVFPETLAGALLLGAFAAYARGGRAADFAGNLLLVLALWTTPRVAAGVLAASAVLLPRDWRERNGAGVAALALGWALFLLGNLWVWGDWLVPNVNPASQNTLAVLPRGALRFFLGNDVGLLLLSPVAWVGLVAGVVNLVALRKRVDVAWAALFAGVFLAVATFPDARAGTCPAGRYQVIPAYLLAFPMVRLLAGELAAWRRRLAPLALLLGLAGLAISLAVAARPAYWFRNYHPLFGFAQLQPYYGLLPPAQGPAMAWASLAWLALLALPLLALLRRR